MTTHDSTQAPPPEVRIAADHSHLAVEPYPRRPDEDLADPTCPSTAALTGDPQY
ncbi:hypothetical protein [Kitasatospora sp. NPDC058478]|uniref:hypothetical protein n=1 Tax=unclassified Kitasatospora TaxID=2633591 RepID=UPI00364AB2BB